ncbi:hypothetical protein ABMA28_004984 [Loxostege sticticalis]|uniref:Inositol-3-phosphate synthase n=1 Tax=Loxostege sticticalis TaxID=481309 RepID=A0ABD0SNX6_LOXSC
MEKNTSLVVSSPNVKYTDDYIYSDYVYEETLVTKTGNEFLAKPYRKSLNIRTAKKVGKVGVMLVGWGGNNGSTFTAAVLANRHQLSWNTKNGTMDSNWFGSITQASTVRMGIDEKGNDVYIPMCHLLPMVHPDDLVIDGWDISPLNLAESMVRAKVIDHDLQQKLKKEMAAMKPRPAIYDPDFIAANQADRATNLIRGTKYEQYLQLRADIKDFKDRHKLDKVIVLWTANTERFCEVREGVHDTGENLEKALRNNEPEISPSTIFAMAAIDEGCCYINGSPQNTLVPGVIERAEKNGVCVAGDDFKSGQTKLKSVLVDFLVSAVPGVIERAEKNGVCVAGDDFKSGQTKLKSVLVDFLVSAAPGVIERAEKNGVCVAGDDFKSGQTKLKSVLVDFLVSAVPGVIEQAEKNGVCVAGDYFKSGQTKLKSVLVDFLVSAVPGVIECAEKNGVCVAGDDFKSGQTKLKSVLVDFLVSAGLKPVSIVSYNHLGNNDGKNLSAPKQFRSKEITKSNVVDDMVESNQILYKPGEKPDHVVVIKYVPYVGDSKRAMDEYTSEILLHGTNTIVVHNTCEDSLLAVPLILDLVLLAELFARVGFRQEDSKEYSSMHTVMSPLSYLLKAPMVPAGAPVINALFKQRACIENLMRACLGLQPNHHLQLEHKVPFMMSELQSGAMFSPSPPSKKQKLAHENGDK